jgi:hypothetical protein
MAYIAPNIKDRIAVGDNIFLMENLGGNLVRLIPQPTEVIEPGTDINKALLQPLANAVEQTSTDLENLDAGTLPNTNAIQVYNITSAHYSDNKYEIELPYDRCYFIFTQQLRGTARPRLKSWGVICKNTNQIMNIGTDSSSGGSTSNDQTMPLIVDIATNGYIVGITTASIDSNHKVVYIAQVVDSKLKFGTGNVTPQGDGVTDNYTGTLALVQI